MGDLGTGSCKDLWPGSKPGPWGTLQSGWQSAPGVGKRRGVCTWRVGGTIHQRLQSEGTGRTLAAEAGQSWHRYRGSSAICVPSHISGERGACPLPTIPPTTVLGFGEFRSGLKRLLGGWVLLHGGQQGSLSLSPNSLASEL